jgi:hypothetical protein
MWPKLKDRLRLAYRALIQSEAHLASIAESARAPRAPASTAPDLARPASALEAGAEHLGFIAATMARQELAKILAEPRYADPLRLERFGFRVHCQYDEDGLIAEIFRRIGTTSRTFVEFGAGIGTENCTGFLLMQGWRGLWIEGHKDFPFFATHTWGSEIRRGQLTLRNTFITVDTIDDTIRDGGFSGEIDFLAVDLDGNDYHVLERISAVAPRVICAEYNAVIPPGVFWRMERNDSFVWDTLDYRTGASLKALETLLDARGYALVGCSIAGVNAFFVRKDLTEGKFAAPFTAENHYNAWSFLYAGSAHKSMWRRQT